MLFKNRILDGIADGTVSLAFRRWNKAAVKKGSRLHTSIGLLEIGDVTIVSDLDITEADAIRAGFSTRGELIKDINAFSREGDIFRIEVTRVGDDPRETLREQDDLTDEQFADLQNRLTRLDRAGSAGPWTAAFLKLIDRHPGVRSTELAAAIGWETENLKLNVRKLKNLGLTISLGTGYRISPRGKAVMNRLHVH
ncbi:ASCH domain-containing protein [Paenibacillus contaminans]|uniref:ASCH domain-containing protein n=1 Tax=Paenibacillus contaminans TaxID=450362 RepID=A0A329LNV9_9BACL|nr:ASCH domain-containing protein [Paenibacillus contaminans]RAV08896.1 ASCH domain-containing protein [Paenibacillus contaminans]